MSLVICHSIFSKDLKEYRALYYGVCLNETDIHDFNDFLELNNNDNTVTKGYQAVIWFLWADYHWSPVKKWKCFNKGKESLDELINNNNDNIELRFLRLTIQENTPKVLGYNTQKEKDKAFIFSRLNSIDDSDLKERITNYLRHNSMAKTE